MLQRMRPVAAGTAPVAPMKVEDVVGLSPIADVGTGRPDPGHVLQIHPTEVGDVLTRVSMGPESAHAWVLEATMPRCAYILDVEASRARDLHNLDMKTIGPRNTHMDLVGTGAALALNLEQPEAGDQCGPGMCPERGVAPIEPREFEQNHSHLQKEPGGAVAPRIPGMEPGWPADPRVQGINPGWAAELQYLDVNSNPEECQDPHTGVVLHAISAAWATWSSSVIFVGAGHYQHPLPGGHRQMGPMIGKAV